MLTPISQLHLHCLDYSGLISLSLRNNKRTDEFCNVIETNIRIFFFFIWIGTEVQWMLLTIFRKCNLICVQTANKNTSYTINDQYTYYICIIKWIVCLLNLFSWNNFTRFQCHFSQSIRKNGSYIDIIFVCTNEWCPLWLDKHCPKAIFVANRVANGHIDFLCSNNNCTSPSVLISARIITIIFTIVVLDYGVLRSKMILNIMVPPILDHIWIYHVWE